MKKILCIVLSMIFMVMTFQIGVYAAAYTDIKSGKWYTNAVNYCLENNLMEPAGDTRFGVNENVTRGEMAYLLWNIAGRPTIEPDDPEVDFIDLPFTDLIRFDKYTDAIRWCAQYKILSGYPSGAFGVNDFLKREQFATAIKSLCEYKGYDTAATATLTEFKDRNNISDYAKNSMMFCVANGVICGTKVKGELLLSPKSYLTRSQSAVIIKAFFDNILSKENAKMRNGKYVLDGGGGTGSGDSFAFWDAIYSLTNKATPNLLYIGFAQTNPSGDYGYIKNLVEGEEYHSKADILTEDDIKDISVAKAKIDNADIIYVCGGSSVRLLDMLKEYKILALIRTAQNRGAIMCGSSAGAICFSAFGESQTALGYWRIDGTAGVNLLYCPHSLTDSARYDKLESELRQTPYINAVALDGACLVVDGNRYKAVIYKTGYMANLCKIVNGEYVVTPLSTEWAPLSDITN